MKFFVMADSCDYDTLTDKLDRVFDDMNPNDHIRVVCTDYKPMDDEIAHYAGERHFDLEIFSPDNGLRDVNTLDDFLLYKKIILSLGEKDKIILIGNSARIRNVKAMADIAKHPYVEV